MNYTEKQLEMIERLASIYMRPSEIALLLDVTPEQFRSDINTHDSPAYKAYHKGKITQKIEVQKQMAILAKVGSPLALEQSNKALLDMEDDE